MESSDDSLSIRSGEIRRPPGPYAPPTLSTTDPVHRSLHMKIGLTFSAFAALLMSPQAVQAQEASEVQRPSSAALAAVILDRNPETRVATVDHERLTARRVDIVDENGVIRMSLGGATPQPIIDGIQYKRAFNVAGLVFYDAAGSERGGLGVADVEGGMAVLAMDHPAMDAIGWRVAPDGAVSFVMNQAPPLIREPDIGNRLIPGVQTPTRIRLDVAANGAPSISLADADDQPRLRLTVTDQGYGALEFLNAAGEVIHTLAPEAASGSN